MFLVQCSSYAEQLVLYMKAEEFLSSALRSAKENIKNGQLFPSTTVKQGETRDRSLWVIKHSLLDVCKVNVKCS